MNKEIYFIKINNRGVAHSKEQILRYKTKIMRVQMAALRVKIKHRALEGLLHWGVKNLVFKKLIKLYKENLTWKPKAISV